jgi:hypothetical protein
LAARLFAGVLVAAVVCASSAGWAAYIAGAGGAAVSEQARLSAVLLAATGKGTLDLSVLQDGATPRLKPWEAAWMIALHGASVRAGRTETPTAAERALAALGMRSADPLAVQHDRQTSFRGGSSVAIDGAVPAIIGSAPEDPVDLGESSTGTGLFDRADLAAVISAAVPAHEAGNLQVLREAMAVAGGFRRQDSAVAGERAVALVVAWIPSHAQLDEGAAGGSAAADSPSIAAFQHAVLLAARSETVVLALVLQPGAVQAVRTAVAELLDGVRSDQVATSWAGLFAGLGGSLGSVHPEPYHIVERAVAQLRAGGGEEASTVLDGLLLTFSASDFAGFVEAAAAGARFAREQPLKASDVSGQAAGLWTRTDAGITAGLLLALLTSRGDVSVVGVSDPVGSRIGLNSDWTISAPARLLSGYRRAEVAATGASAASVLWFSRRDAQAVLESAEVRTARSPTAVFGLETAASAGSIARCPAEVAIRHMANAEARGRLANTAPIRESVDSSLTFATSGAPVSTRAAETAVAEPTTVPGPATPGQPDGDPSEIVPPTVVRATSAKAEVLSVVWPGRPATLHVPDHGVTLRVPAGARQAVFQTRIAVEAADSLEVKPAGDVLRVVRIELFDGLGRPVADPTPEKPLDLVIRLDTADRGRQDLIRLQRFEPAGAVPTWVDVPIVEITPDEVVAALDHLSLFALVARGDGPVAAQPDPGSTSNSDAPDIAIVRETGREGNAWALALAVVVAAGTGLALGVWEVVRGLRRRSRSP